ncbi:MAG: BON domain-containing protein, partial [Alphaproteobacteria bacterium]|nr:BON domain-containing protein [Alphaproteobacteria bacterium]
MTRDEQIKSDIVEELEWDPRVQASDVGVTVKDGAVTLTGTIKSFPAKIAAEQAAKRVKGVRAIAEEIVVRL